jgi:hypothetical protein
MTLTRQQKQIVDAGTLIALDRATDQDKAFLARQMVQTTLPHSDPGNVPVWSRANGPMTLIIQQGYDKTGKPYGHPYGIIPRLLMYWMTTEAVRTKDLRIELGDSLAGFMDELGLDSRGKGARSDRVRLQDQMNRLFSSLIRFETTGTSSDGVEYDAQENMLIAEKRVFWWDHRHPEQRTLWGSYVQLDPKFFKAITANPVPVDLRALRAIKRSPLALDLYSLLTYQAFKAGKGGKSRFMSWKQLQSSLGTSYGEPADLRRAVKAALLKIQAVYPELALGERDGGIEVLPKSLPAIAAP